MAAFPRSAHALKRVVVGLESELAPILSLGMAARDVQATRRKHATRKPVKVRHFVSKLFLSFFLLSVSVLVCLDGVHSWTYCFICVSSGAWRLFALQWML